MFNKLHWYLSRERPKLLFHEAFNVGGRPVTDDRGTFVDWTFGSEGRGVGGPHGWTKILR